MSSCGEPSIATSWLAVLMGNGGVPVARYKAPAPTRAATTAVLCAGPPVPVVERVAEQIPGPVEQPEIVAPRVDADARDRFATTGDGGGDPLGQVREQRERVPVQALGQRHRPVDEPVRLGDRQPVVTQRAAQHATTLGAEVNGQIVGHRPSLASPRHRRVRRRSGGGPGLRMTVEADGTVVQHGSFRHVADESAEQTRERNRLTNAQLPTRAKRGPGRPARARRRRRLTAAPGTRARLRTPRSRALRTCVDAPVAPTGPTHGSRPVARPDR